jgi:hypothetical protein
MLVSRLHESYTPSYAQPNDVFGSLHYSTSPIHTDYMTSIWQRKHRTGCNMRKHEEILAWTVATGSIHGRAAAGDFSVQKDPRTRAVSGHCSGTTHQTTKRTTARKWPQDLRWGPGNAQKKPNRESPRPNQCALRCLFRVSSGNTGPHQ